MILIDSADPRGSASKWKRFHYTKSLPALSRGPAQF